MSAKYKSPSFLLPNELNTSANPANDTGINSLYSMDFDGSSQYITLGSISSINTDFTISGWINTNDTSLSNSAYRAWFSTGTFNNVGQFVISVSNSSSHGGVGFVNVWEANQLRIAGTSNVADGNWHHIVLKKTSTELKLYVDGSLQNTASNTTTFTFPSAYIGIGAGGAGVGNQGKWNGQIDEVAIFNRALTDGTGGTVNEIAALYGGTSPNIYPSNLIASNLNPIAYYPLGEQAQMQGYLGNEASSEWQFPNGVLQDYVMDFDGSTDYIDAGSSVGAIGTGVRTFSVWLKTSSNAIQTILGTRNINTDGWVIQWNGPNTGVLFYRPLGGGNNGIYSTTGNAANLTDGNWHHLVIVRAGTGNNKIYVDGVSQTLNTAFGDENLTDPQSSKNLLIGAGYTTGGALFRYFDGEMSNLAIWNSDQSANIANIYNNGSPQTSYTVTPQNWWKLNADSVYTPSAPNYTKALDFVASESDYIDAGNPADLQITGELSISLWFKTSTTPATSGYLISKGVSPYTSRNFAIWFSNNNTVRAAVNGVSGLVTSPASNYNDDNWHHCVFTFTPSTSTILYIDGSAVVTNTTSIPSAITNNTSNLEIGRYVSEYFNGQISNAAIFNSALTASQVSTLFNFGTPETNISFSPQAWWKLDDQTAITDYSGNGNTGTNNGATDATTSVAVVPSWKIPNALPITTTPNYTTALDFNGSDKVENNFSLANGTTKFSVSFWMFTDNNTGDQAIISNDSGNVAQGYSILKYSNGVLSIKFQGSQYSSLTSISLNAWQYVVATYDSGTLKLYLNNTEIMSNSSAPTSVGNITTPKTRFSGFNSGVIPYDGYISNAAIYGSALTHTQVSTLYNNGTPETAISFSPIGWWKLDTGGSTITDYGSGGNNGTNTGAAQVTSDVLTSQPVNGVSTTLPSTALQQSDLQFDSPYSNYSLSFDGTGDYIDFGNVNSIKLGAGDFSFSAWINPESYTSAYQAIYVNYGTNGVFIGKNPSGDFILRIFGVADIIAYSTLPTTNTWTHICITRNSGTCSLFYNGSSVATATSTHNFNGSGNVFLGSDNGGADFNGKIDETSIFNYGLSEAQVLEIYNNGKPNNLDNFSGTAPISWWRLGENAYFNTGTTPGPEFTVPNSIAGAPNGIGSGTITTMISADAPGTYANSIGTNLDILDRVGDAALSTSNSQSYNMIPDDKVPYVPGYVGDQIANNFSMSFDSASNTYFNAGNLSSINGLQKVTYSFWMNDSSGGASYPIGTDGQLILMPLINSNRFDVYLNGTSGSARIYNNQTLTVLNTNQWHHIVLVINSTLSTASQRTKLYIDGNAYPDLSGTAITQNATIGTVTTDTNIGRASGSTPAYFTGKIDEVAIFDTALNAGQIYNDIYQPTASAPGNNQTADLVNNPNLPNPVAWYRMGD